MNSAPTFSSGEWNNFGSGWGAFTRWLLGAVFMVLVFFVLTNLGGWSQHALTHGRGAGLLEAFAGALVFGALSALGLVLAWNYFARIKHSATWFVRMWLFACASGVLLTSSELPGWLEVVTFAVWLAFLWWTRKGWGMNWMEGNRSNQESARA
jgi:hypothetical protein